MNDSFGAGPDVFGNAIRHIRKARGLSQRDLAARLDVPRTRLARIEAGEIRMPLKSAIGRYRVLGFEVGLLHPFPGARCGKLPVRHVDSARASSSG